MGSLTVDTSFLIDLIREQNRRHVGPARRFLDARAEARLFVSWVVPGEFGCGIATSVRELWQAQLEAFRVLDWTPEVAWVYSRSYRYLRDVGLLIGTNDLWIAATSIVYGLPLVTGNVEHFRRVPGLEVLGYA